MKLLISDYEARIEHFHKRFIAVQIFCVYKTSTFQLTDLYISLFHSLIKPGLRKCYCHWFITKLLIKQLNHFATLCHSHTKVFSAPNVHHDVILPKPLEPGLLYHKQTSGYHWCPEKHNPLSYIKLICVNVNAVVLRYLARNLLRLSNSDFQLSNVTQNQTNYFVLDYSANLKPQYNVKQYRTNYFVLDYSANLKPYCSTM